MSFSDTQQIAGFNGGKNEETGVVDLTITWFVPTQAEIFTVGEARVMGVPIVGRNFSNWEPDSDSYGYQVDLKYAGKSDDDPYSESWSFTDSFRERPIETHPELQQLLADYGGRIEDEKVVWPETIGGVGSSFSGVAGALDLGLSSTASDLKAHPFFGEDTILIWSSIATRQYYTTNLSAVFADVGEIFDKLPGDGPTIHWENGQNWIKRIPKPATSGDGWLVSEEYWSSGPGGWKPGVDKLIVR